MTVQEIKNHIIERNEKYNKYYDDMDKYISISNFKRLQKCKNRFLNKIKKLRLSVDSGFAPRRTIETIRAYDHNAGQYSWEKQACSGYINSDGIAKIKCMHCPLFYMSENNYNKLYMRILIKKGLDEWVDVNDRLPTKVGNYLVTAFDTVKGDYVTGEYYFGEENKNEWKVENAEETVLKVIAWKPLPEPYKRKE